MAKKRKGKGKRSLPLPESLPSYPTHQVKMGSGNWVAKPSATVAAPVKIKKDLGDRRSICGRWRKALRAFTVAASCVYDGPNTYVHMLDPENDAVFIS